MAKRQRRLIHFHESDGDPTYCGLPWVRWMDTIPWRDDRVCEVCDRAAFAAVAEYMTDPALAAALRDYEFVQAVRNDDVEYLPDGTVKAGAKRH